MTRDYSRIYEEWTNTPPLPGAGKQSFKCYSSVTHRVNNNARPMGVHSSNKDAASYLDKRYGNNMLSNSSCSLMPSTSKNSTGGNAKNGQNSGTYGFFTNSVTLSGSNFTSQNQYSSQSFAISPCSSSSSISTPYHHHSSSSDTANTMTPFIVMPSGSRASPLREYSPQKDYCARRPIFPKSKFLRKAQQLRKLRTMGSSEKKVDKMRKEEEAPALRRAYSEEEVDEGEESEEDDLTEGRGRIANGRMKLEAHEIEIVVEEVKRNEEGEDEEEDDEESSEDETMEESDGGTSCRSSSILSDRTSWSYSMSRSVTMSPSVTLCLPMPFGDELPPMQPSTSHHWRRSPDNVSPVERLKVDEVNFTFRAKPKAESGSEDKKLANGEAAHQTTNSGDKSPRWRGDPANEAIKRQQWERPKKNLKPSPLSASFEPFTSDLVPNGFANASKKASDEWESPKSPNDAPQQPHSSSSARLKGPSEMPAQHQLINGLIIPQLVNSTKVPQAEFITATVSAIIAGAKLPIYEEELEKLSTEPKKKEEEQEVKKPIIVEDQCRFVGKLAGTPKFHFPLGRPVSKTDTDQVLAHIRELFDSHPRAQLHLDNFDELCRRLGFAIYTKRAVYDACCHSNGLPILPALAPSSVAEPDGQDGMKVASQGAPIDFNQFCVYWNRMISEANDEASRFVYTLSAARNSANQNHQQQQQRHILRDDFVPMMMDLILTHPGLHFLKEAPQFYSRYADVVIVRIFWNVNRSWTGKITVNELRRSNFLQTLHMLDEVQDINKVTDYFSYEHFYVTYCKFWELDTDHDMIISREDMRKHCNGALTDRIIERIFSAAVIRTPPEQRTVPQPIGPVRQQPIETIGFEDFVSFLLAEEDKRHPTSIEYWFRCVDLDGDGQISLYEMEYFYEAIEQKLLAKNMETLSLRDVICNLLDSISPANGHSVTRRDLKNSGLAHRFFNTFVNWIKYVDQESSDGERASVKTNEDKELSDWEMFCLSEYELLMSETEQLSNEGDVDENIDVCLDDEEDEGGDQQQNGNETAKEKAEVDRDRDRELVVIANGSIGGAAEASAAFAIQRQQMAAKAIM